MPYTIQYWCWQYRVKAKTRAPAELKMASHMRANFGANTKEASDGAATGGATATVVLTACSERKKRPAVKNPRVEYVFTYSCGYRSHEYERRDRHGRLNRLL